MGVILADPIDPTQLLLENDECMTAKDLQHFQEIESIIQQEALAVETQPSTTSTTARRNRQDRSKKHGKNPMMDKIKNALRQPHLADLAKWPAPSMGDVSR